MLPFLLVLLPFVVFFVLLLVKRSPLIIVSLITLGLVLATSFFFWKMSFIFAAAALIKGFLVALDIFFIIFGALFFLDIMKKTGIIENIGVYLEDISKDLRIQVIFLAWFFENFLEGTAGFGTPSTVVAPLLVGLGIAPLDAVIIALLGNSTSVAFGAAGTPIKVGFGDLAGSGVPLIASKINLIGILVPIFMVWFITKNKPNFKREFTESLPFAIWAGIAFTIPSIFSVYLGKEFPSILGSVIGLILVLITTKLGFLVPDKEKNLAGSNKKATLSLPKVVLPYVLLIILLIAGKFLIGSAGFALPLLVKHTFAYFNPGFAFIVVGIITVFLMRVKFGDFSKTLGSSFKRSIEPFLVITFMSALAQIMLNSQNNASNLPSMIEVFASTLRNSFLPLAAPILGMFGSFLTGSATVSNLMFGNFLATAARDLSMNVDKILSLALIGGAAGNMIALADIIAAETVVGLKNKEREVLGGVIVPCAIYILLTGIVGMLII